MSNREFLACDGPLTSDLADQLGAFVESLVAAGYRKATWQEKRRILESFVLWMRGVPLSIADIDECCIDRYLEGVLRRPYKRGRMERGTLLQFFEYLRHVGVAPPCVLPEPSPEEILVEHYVDYLRCARGLSERSIAIYTPIIRRFVVTTEFAEAEDQDAALNATAVREYVLAQARERSCELTRLMTIALRSFLRFLFLDGRLSRDISTAVPTVRRWRLATVPPILSAAEVEQVLTTIDCSTTRGRRARAILLLVARLGLRPGEVANLELDDIHWTEGEILVRGKGGLQDRLPLPEDVGEALVCYLREDRGCNSSRSVFLRLRAPRIGLSGPCAISAVARDAIHRAGLRPHRRVGAHLFRHALATRMIRNGASMAEISQALRHRCASTTRIYAKVDFAALRGVARAWPGNGDER